MKKRLISGILLIAILFGTLFTACERGEGSPETTEFITDTTEEIMSSIEGTTDGVEPIPESSTAVSPDPIPDPIPDSSGAATSEKPDNPPVILTGGSKETTAREPSGTAGEPAGTTGTPETTAPETTAPETAEQTTAESTTTPPAPPVVEPTEIDPTVPGTLLYYESFDGRSTTSSNAATMNALGWRILSGADGAYSSNTATYSIVSSGSGKRLEVKNYVNSTAGSDSYVEILSPQTFAYLNGQSFTYQYDVTYTSASNDSRYIVLVSSYNGEFYQSFHLRNSGAYNNECHTSGEWKRYATAGNVLSPLGISGSTLNNVTVTLRYVVDWENGCRIYARVAGGSWVLISRLDPSGSDAAYFDPDRGGTGFTLKVGGGQNGYVDNIIVWSGTTDAPTSLTAKPFISSTDRCHRMQTVGGKELCTLCGRTESEIENAWLLTDIPRYDGGTPSRNIYLAGQGLDPAQPLSKEDRMQIVAGTSADEFRAYISKLKSAGYTKEFERTVEGNLFASYVKGSTRVYTYYIENARETRVIAESTSVSVSVAEFDYTYTKKSGDTTGLYQYAMPLVDETHTWGENYVDRGMLYVVKLADNRVVIFDGGESVQFTDARIDDLMAFLREITGVGKNGTVTIAAWFLTHAHQDHMQGFFALARRYKSYLDLERIFYTVPSWHSENTTIQNVNNSVVRRMLSYIPAYFGNDVEFLKVHTGQEIRLADVTFEILYTHEDIVDPMTAETRIADNYNEGSSVVKITFDGKSALITGDIDKKAASVLMRNWTIATLKVDVLQLAHHVLNNLSDLYKLLQTKILLVPQGAYKISTHGTAKPTFAVAESYADPNMIFFQNVQTVGLAVEDGKVKLVYTRPLQYESKKFYWPDP